MTTSPRITLDALLEKLAKDTWENLREAKIMSVRFGEETITDTLMLEFRRNGFMAFKQTALRDEAKYGTDFECWVGSNSTGSIGYAVQCKKLAFNSGTYQNLGHVVKVRDKRQIDILRAYATVRKMTPMYCLYSHSPYVEKAFLQCCSRSFPEEELGCTLTPLSTIETAIAFRGRKNFQSLQRDWRTVPWRCLAKCPRLQRSLGSRSLAPVYWSPLLDADSTILRRLPDEVGNLLEERRRFEPQLRPLRGSRREGEREVDFEQWGIPVDPRGMDYIPERVSTLGTEGEREVDFEQWGIGVDSREMDYRDEDTPRFVIPKRVYILELPEESSSRDSPRSNE